MARGKITAIVGRDQRGDWTIEAGRFRATLPATGPEVDAWVDAGKSPGVGAGQAPERVSKLAAKVVSRTRHKPGTIPHQEHRDPNRGLNHFAIVDGEEVVEVRPVSYRYGAASAWLAVCDSPRCRMPRSEFPYREPVYEGPSKEGAEEAARQHRAWHSENFPLHPRIVLDAWIRNNAMVSAPEPAAYQEWGGAKFDQALAIAKAEQAEQKTGRS